MPSKSLFTNSIANLCALSSVMLPICANAQVEGTVELPLLVLNSADNDDTSIVAQTNSSGSKLPEEALDTSSSVSVITQREIELRGASDLEEVLGYTAGVSVNEFGSDTRYDNYRIRGFDPFSAGGAFYRDGTPLRTYNFIVPRIEPYSVERIEVLKGTNSTLFGLNSPGGLINAITKRPTDDPLYEVYTTLGEDHVELGFDISEKLAEDSDWSFRLTGKYQDSEYTYDASKDDRIYIGAALSWKPSAQTNLTFTASYYEREGTPGAAPPRGFNIGPNVFLGEPEFNTFDTLETSLGYIFAHEFDNGLTFRSTGRFHTADLLYEQVFFSSPAPGIVTPAPSDFPRVPFFVEGASQQLAFDNQLQYDTEFGAFSSRSLLGVEYTLFEGNDATLSGIAPVLTSFTNPAFGGRGSLVFPLPATTSSADQDTFSVYVQEELTLNDRLILTLGTRYDDVTATRNLNIGGAPLRFRQTYGEFTWRAGATYKISDQASVYGNYSESFNVNLTLPDPLPTEGEQYEVGFKYSPIGFNGLFTAAIYQLTQSNVTLLTPAGLNNSPETRVRGLELEGRFEISDRWQVVAAYAYQDGEITIGSAVGTGNTTGKKPLRVPEQLASLWVSYSIPANGRFGRTTFSGGVRYVGEHFADNLNTLEIGDYAVVDAAITYQLQENTELSLNVKNLFDKTYRTSGFGVQDFFGETRTIEATLRHNF